MDLPRLVGINHVALEVGSIEEALAFYGRFFELHLRGVVPGMAFIDMGDQFLALSEGREQGRDQGRHFGLVVDDKERVRAALEAEAEVDVVPGPRLDFCDPWGNRIEIVDYRDIQFTKAPPVLEGMGLDAGQAPGGARAAAREGPAVATRTERPPPGRRRPPRATSRARSPGRPASR